MGFVRWLRRLGAALSVLVVLGALALVWAFQTGRALSFVRRELLSTLATQCQVEARFRSISIDVLARQIQLSEVEIEDQNGKHLVSVSDALVNWRILPLFYGRLQFNQIALLEPSATLQLKEGQLLNLPKCLKGGSQSSETSIYLDIDELHVERAEISLQIDDKFSGEFKDIGIALTPSPSGGSDIAIGVNDAQTTLFKKPLLISNLRALLHVEGNLTSPRALLLDELKAKLADVELSASGSVDLLGPVYQAQVDVTLPIVELSRWIDGFPKNSSGVAELSAQLVGSSDSPSAAGTLVLKKAKIADYGIGDRADIRFRADKEGARFDRVSVRLGRGTVVAKGKLKFDEKLSLEASATTRGLSLAHLLDQLAIKGSWVDFHANGKADVKGTLKPTLLDGDIDFDLPDLTVATTSWLDKKRDEALMLEPRPLRVKGRWRFDDDSLSFLGATIRGPGTTGSADARIVYDGPEIDVKTEFESLDFADVGPIGGVEILGFGPVSAVVKGRGSKFSAYGTADLEALSVAQIPLGSASANVAWTKLTHLDFTSIEGRLGRSTYHGSVGILFEGDFPLSIDGELSKGDVSDLFLPFRLKSADWGDPKGPLRRGSFQLQGPITQLTGNLDLEAGAIEIVGEKFSSARLDGRMERGRVVADNLILAKYGAKIYASGFVDPNTSEIAGHARTRGAKLSDLNLVRDYTDQLKGDLQLQLNLAGTFSGVTGTIAADISKVVAGDLELGDGHYAGPLKGKYLYGKGELFGGKMKLDSRISMESRLPYLAEVEFDEMPLASIYGQLAKDPTIIGKSTLKASLSGRLVDWNRADGEIDLRSTQVKMGNVEVSTAQRSELKLKKGVLSTPSLVLQIPRGRAEFDGRLGAKVVDLNMTARLDLQALSSWVANIERSSGSLAIDGRLGGSLSDVELVGTGKVEGAALQWRGIDNRISGVNAELSFSQNTVFVDRARGRWAGGKLDLTGSVLLKQLQPTSVSLSLVADSVRPRFSWPWTDLSALLNGELQIVGKWPRLSITGMMDVTQGRARPKTDIADLVGSTKLADAYDPAAEVLEFDILMRSLDKFLLKNDVMALEALGELRLTGTNERIGLLGSASFVQGGRVSFIGRDYIMEAGVVEFRDRLRFVPRYDLSLSTEACSARIRMSLVGDLSAVNTSYTSSPEMGQEDIISCIVRGVKKQDLDQDLASFAGSALIKLSGVDREVKKVLQIDTLDVTTEFSSQARAYEPRVIVAKDLSLLDRPARLEYSTSLLRNNDQRAAFKVRLAPQLNLQLGWTSSEDVPFGDWGLDLKRRWQW